jgi:Domain of unknown function (DUF4397)
MMLAVTMLIGVSASNAWALDVRLVHAVPGAGSAHLSAGKASTGPVGFAGVSSEAKAPNGTVALRLVSTGGNKTLAQTTKTLNEGQYTVVATKKGDKVSLLVFRDQDAKKGRATLRVIHAAPELGSANVTADGKSVAKGLAFEDASPYSDLEPGSYKLDAVRPTGKGGALATKSAVNLEAGTSATAVLAGSGGQPTTFVLASDSAAAPSKAPQTGLGGLSGGVPWLAALLAALAAGALGGAGYRLATRRGG